MIFHKSSGGFELKKTLGALLTLSFAFLCVFLVSCDDSSSPSGGGGGANPIVGTWHLTGGSQDGVDFTPEELAYRNETMIFNSDGTGTLIERGDILGLTWSTSGDSLTMFDEEDDGGTYPYSISGNTMTTEYPEDNQINIYTRAGTEDLSVAGTWDLEVSVDGEAGTFNDVWILEQSGNNISMKYHNVSGTLSGDSLYLHGLFNGEDANFYIRFFSTEHGQLQLSGNWNMNDGTMTGEFEGVRTSLSTELPSFNVPTATITIDGNTADWQGIPAAITDQIGDGSELSGSDIESLHLAQDEENVYALITLANGAPDPTLYYGIQFSRNYYSDEGDRFIHIKMSIPACSVEERFDTSGYHNFVANGVIASNNNYIEVSVPLDQLNPPSRSFCNAWSDVNETLDSTYRFFADF